jgi:phosphate transport system substrate-binding protein
LWKQLGGNDAPIKIYGRDDNSDIGEFIEAEFMEDEGIASSAITFPKNSELYSAVARDKNGIGFRSVNLALNPNVRFVAVKASSSGAAVSPTTVNIPEHLYPLVRPPYYAFSRANHWATLNALANGCCRPRASWWWKRRNFGRLDQRIASKSRLS